MCYVLASTIGCKWCWKNRNIANRLFPKVDELVVDQMRWVRLSYLIVSPSVEMSHDMEEGPPRRDKPFAIANSAKSDRVREPSNRGLSLLVGTWPTRKTST